MQSAKRRETIIASLSEILRTAEPLSAGSSRPPNDYRPPPRVRIQQASDGLRETHLDAVLVCASVD